MGRATIIEHLGEGRYRIWPEYDWSRLEAELAHLKAKDAAMKEKQQKTAQDIELQIGRVNVIVDDLNRAIEKWKAGEIGETLGDPEASISGDLYSSGKLEKIEAPKVPGVPEEIYSLTKKCAEEKIKLEGLREEQAAITAGFVTREQRRIALGNERKRIDGKEITAWCVDYSTEIAPMTKVRTIEVPGYRLKGEPSMNIAPGGAGTAGVKYGQLRSALTMTPETVFLNAALEPGHLKWRPRWRYGQITWISESEDVCNVALEQEWGRRVDVAPKMPLNDKAALDNVPIRYMSCNRAAFEVGDWVVVEWKNGEPTVVGFRREPRECIPPRLILNPRFLALRGERSQGRGSATGDPETGQTVTFNGSTICDPVGDQYDWWAWVSDFYPFVTGLSGFLLVSSLPSYPGEYQYTADGGVEQWDADGYWVRPSYISGDFEWQFNESSIQRATEPCVQGGSVVSSTVVTGTMLMVRSNDWSAFWDRVQRPATLVIQSQRGNQYSYDFSRYEERNAIYVPAKRG